MPNYSTALIERFKVYCLKIYGREITTEEAVVFLSQLADYFLTIKPAGEGRRGQRPHGIRSIT